MRYFNIDYKFLNLFHFNITLFREFIIFSLPNGLWVLSGLLLLQILLYNNKKLLFLYSIIFIIISIVIEISQLYDLLSGTFDINDLITILVFSSIGLYIGKLRRLT
jgi:hypothetical protein